jgi:hypothetical protein
MRNCIDEGTLQALTDGELSPDEAAQVSAHLNVCAHCAESARSIESENALLMEGLSAEFGQAIPTQRLRNNLDAALSAQRAPARPSSQSWLSAIRDFIPSFRTLAYASAVAAVLLAVTAAFVYFKKTAVPPTEIVKRPVEVAPPAPQLSPQPPSPEQVIARGPDKPVKVLQPTVIKPVRRKAAEPDATSLAWQERQYERAIAQLNEAVKAQAPLRPSLRVEYEYNMAILDNAIATTREAARKNPKDPQAAQFVLSAYQSKVDLMNQIADPRTLER